MTARDGRDVESSDVPDECPYCGADLTIDRRTEIESFHTARKAFTYEEHMTDEHPAIWWVADTIARVKRTLRQLKP